jgi:hypothetical protein
MLDIGPTILNSGEKGRKLYWDIVFIIVAQNSGKFK